MYRSVGLPSKQSSKHTDVKYKRTERIATD